MNLLKALWVLIVAVIAGIGIIFIGVVFILFFGTLALAALGAL